MDWKSEKQKEDYLFIWIIHVVCILFTLDT